MRRTKIPELTVLLAVFLFLGAAMDHLARAARPDVRAAESVRARTRLLKARLATASAEPAPLAPPGPPAETDPAALGRANALIDHALQTRVWGPAEGREFRPLLAHLAGADRNRVLLRMAIAINTQAFTVDIPGRPPF